MSFLSDEFMDDMEKIRHAQALQALFGELDQGLGSVTHYIVVASFLED